MAPEELIPVYERTLYHVLARLRDIRAEATLTLSDPWAFRQAMITVMAIDTAVALERGVRPQVLAGFDELAELKAQEFIDNHLEEWVAHGR